MDELDGNRAAGLLQEVFGWDMTVAAATCADANTAATAAIIRGDRAPGWRTSRNLPARLVAQDGAVRIVAGWP